MKGYTMECVCGARFRTMIKEAKHKHNFPLLCKPRKRVKPPKPTKRPQVMEAGR